MTVGKRPRTAEDTYEMFFATTNKKIVMPFDLTFEKWVTHLWNIAEEWHIRVKRSGAAFWYETLNAGCFPVRDPEEMECFLQDIINRRTTTLNGLVMLYLVEDRVGAPTNMSTYPANNCTDCIHRQCETGTTCRVQGDPRRRDIGHLYHFLSEEEAEAHNPCPPYPTSHI